MAFTSNLFLFILFPLFIVAYYLFRNSIAAKKSLIFLANTVFYMWGGKKAFALTCGICLLLWFCVKVLVRYQKRIVYICSCVLLLLPLLLCKYTGFVLGNIENVLHSSIQTPKLLVPIGLSFYTFEAISLLSDTYKSTGEIIGYLSLFDIYLYLTFFPTVVSGPIIRYEKFKEGFSNTLTANFWNCGIERIAIGLCKKMLIADKIAVLADFCFGAVAAGNAVSSTGLWMGSIAYSLQLYYDFSGYSDMAIGIAALLGFILPENFDKPYQANSIQDFWRRWHISLSTWFRDYIYIPLGGNRCTISRNIWNLLIVWLLTGIWHGADWSFAVWGLGYFGLLLAEKYIHPLKTIGRHWYGHLYALFFINLLWVPFRAENVQVAMRYIAGMFSFTGGIEEKMLHFIPLVCIGIILCLPWKQWLGHIAENKLYRFVRGIAILGFTGIALCAALNATYSPYIYGKF